jgi:acyl-CoA dehydrogenase
MNFELSPELIELRQRVRTFVDEHIIPYETEIATAEDRKRLKAFQTKAREEKLWTPHLPVAWGGLGLGPIGMATLFREMGRSPVGAKVFNCDAPDQGNMDLLLSSSSDAQRDRWLRPLVDGTITSAFCMTEPAPGAGADPTNLATTAKAVGDKWEINGNKWFATGAKNASLLFVMARTSDDPKTGASLFLVDRKHAGVRYDDLPQDTHVRTPSVSGTRTEPAYSHGTAPPKR